MCSQIGNTHPPHLPAIDLTSSHLFISHPHFTCTSFIPSSFTTLIAGFLASCQPWQQTRRSPGIDVTIISLPADPSSHNLMDDISVLWDGTAMAVVIQGFREPFAATQSAGPLTDKEKVDPLPEVPFWDLFRTSWLASKLIS